MKLDLTQNTYFPHFLEEPPTNALWEPSRADASACLRVLLGRITVDEAAAHLTISEKIVVALAFGRVDLLPSPYRDFRSAWRRLDERQRTVVDLAARGYWEGHSEVAERW